MSFYDPGAKRKIRLKLYLLQEGKCAYCGLHCTLTDPKAFAYFTLDHIIPRAKGGTNYYQNLVGCCVPCNLRKGSRTEASFCLVTVYGEVRVVHEFR